QRSSPMPIFEYRCETCGHRFELLVFGSEKPACPKCSSMKLEKQLSGFAVNAPARGGGRGRACESPGGG
ncbi:MAG: zinc ribbon domain-containing protein, partial [Planctomycetota bacterium]